MLEGRLSSRYPLPAEDGGRGGGGREGTKEREGGREQRREGGREQRREGVREEEREEGRRSIYISNQDTYTEFNRFTYNCSKS